jgi:hypothetical protein
MEYKSLKEMIEYFEEEDAKCLEISDEVKDMIDKKYGWGKYKKIN